MIAEHQAALDQALQQLQADYARFQADDALLKAAFQLAFDIRDWRYTTANDLDLEPYANQLNGYNPGRLLKKKYAVPMEAKLLGHYAHGFIDDKLTLTVCPTEFAGNLPTLYYLYLDDRIIRLTIHYQFSEAGIERMHMVAAQTEFRIGETVRAFVGMNAEYQEHHFKLYEYRAGKPVKYCLWISKWPGENILDLHYDDSGELVRVSSPAKGGGTVDIWKHKGKPWRRT